MDMSVGIRYPEFGLGRGRVELCGWEGYTRIFARTHTYLVGGGAVDLSLYLVVVYIIEIIHIFFSFIGLDSHSFETSVASQV